MLLFRRGPFVALLVLASLLGACQGFLPGATQTTATTIAADSLSALVGRVVNAEGKPRAGVVVTAWLNNTSVLNTTAARRTLAKIPRQHDGCRRPVRLSPD